ncbi:MULTISPECIES: GntR family transcriptional regulator [Bacillaceae]|uniref:GntR family transcriptional regulator n=1 Tax=Bacillaceae TaxID=186817 RepID=UPI001E5ADDEF|nr:MULTISPECIES: GntR family transcriptional regulator [Bacillaceae]MCE4047631.1 GntR family transcriptional regulator [Bacillus sp. Au-Bac7]MCM3031077.1 GntR family transcriptional regulator [Niallia sp. MER 6]MDL0437370.1 GntR family transcriptional regulator [Niallia sp. SS-2023]UPO86027.1 GntR family transcriptional regulator [Niallia sp. Man26]
MFELDIRSRTPIYEQLVEKLIELIVTGVLKADEQLPSVRTMATQLTINPNTIQKAYRELEVRGYIYSVQGKGSFVKASEFVQDDSKIKEALERLEKAVKEALYLGIQPEDLLMHIRKLIN